MKKALAVVLSLLLIFTVASCDNQIAQTSSVETSSQDITEDTKINIAVLKGPTAFGSLGVMAPARGDESPYNFTVAAAPEEVSGKLIKGEYDIAAVPTNLAATLYNKTNGEVQMLAVNTLGTLYVVSKNVEINSVSDLKGKTIYVSGQGSTPEFALDYILSQNSIDPDNDVTIEFKSEHSEVVALLATSESGIAVLPEPFVTNANVKDENIKVALDLTKEWRTVGEGSELVMGCLVVRKSFAEENKDAVLKFLDEYKKSIELTATDVDYVAQLSGQLDIVPEAVAKKAIPNCNIKYLDGEEMKTAVNGFLTVLFNAEPKSVGGKLPDDTLYFNK